MAYFMAFTAVLPFLALLVATLALARLTSRWLLDLIGDRAYVILLWPGVVVHELSHLGGALLTLTKVTGFSLWPKAPTSGGRVLGSVTHELTGNPVSLVLISSFPVLGGAFVLWLITALLVPAAPLTAPVISVGGDIGVTAWAYAVAWWSFVRATASALTIGAWQSWLFIYLALCVSAHLAPSNRDLSYTAAGFTALSILTVLITWAGSLVGQPVGERLAQWFGSALGFFTPLLAYAFALLIGIAVVVGLATGLKRLNQRVVWW